MNDSLKPAKLYITAGYPASGKTTVSEQLAAVTGAKIIRTDDMRKELFPVEINYFGSNPGYLPAPEMLEKWIDSNDGEGIDFQQVVNPLAELGGTYLKVAEKYAPKIKEQKSKVYGTAFEMLDKNLSEGLDTIFDAAFSKKDMRDRVYDIASKNGIDDVYIIQVVCSEDVVKSRLEARANGSAGAVTSNAKQLDVYRIVKKEFDQSQIESDKPGVNLMRFVYPTDTHKTELYGAPDSVTRMIQSKVLGALTEKYR